MIGAPPVSPKTFQEYVIPFWFRESIFKQDASLGILSDKSRSSDNTGKLKTYKFIHSLFSAILYFSIYFSILYFSLNFSYLFMGLFLMCKKIRSLAIKQEMLQQAIENLPERNENNKRDR